MEIKARFRLGTETRANKYWETEENRICRLCRKGEEILQHVFEICDFTGEKHEGWKQQINGARALARMEHNLEQEENGRETCIINTFMLTFAQTRTYL